MLSLESICDRMEIACVDSVDDALQILKKHACDYWDKGLFNSDFLMSAFSIERLQRHGIFCDEPLSKRVIDSLPEGHQFLEEEGCVNFFVLSGYVIQDLTLRGHYFNHASSQVRKGIGAFWNESSGIIVGEAYGYGANQSHVDGRDKSSVFLSDSAVGSYTGNCMAVLVDQATGFGYDEAVLMGLDNSSLILRNQASATCRDNCFFTACQEASLLAEGEAFGITFGSKVRFTKKAPYWVVGVGSAPHMNDSVLQCPVVDPNWEPLQDLSKWRNRFPDNKLLLGALKEALHPQLENSRGKSLKR